MKKIKVLSALLAALMLMSLLAGCGGGSDGATEVGTWENSEIELRTIEQGKLNTLRYNTITLYSDNTFTMVNTQNTYYSGDGGENFNPVNYISCIVSGKYETVDVNEEIGDRTIKFTEITRVQSGEFDSDKDANDTNKEAMKSDEVIGVEIILTSDCKISEVISVFPYFRMTRTEE